MITSNKGQQAKGENYNVLFSVNILPPVTCSVMMYPQHEGKEYRRDPENQFPQESVKLDVELVSGENYLSYVN